VIQVFKPGAKVWANTGGDDKIGFILSGPEGPEDKYVVQIGSGAHSGMGYREPEDRDANGAGLTFWKVAK
jgi:hypothetical protein